MSIEILHSGIRISDIVDNRLVSKLYIGYTKKEAIDLFINEFGGGI